MCGIIGFKGVEEPINKIQDGLKRLDYRGYDSWGIANEEHTVKKEGVLPDKHLKYYKHMGDMPVPGNEDTEAVIGHTRWATHGNPTQENAHPHEDCDGRFAVAHNGIIENYEGIKENLTDKGHEFKSETDTEVIPHFLEHHTDAGRTTREALQLFDEEATGDYAVLVLDRKTEELYGLKRGSPLIFGHDPHQGEAYFASDLYALSPYIEEAFFMDDGDLVKTNGSNLAIWREGKLLEEADVFEEFEWTEEEPTLPEQYDHWMEKEISEIPEAMMRLEKHLGVENEGIQEDMESLCNEIQAADKVIFTGSGTSYHATLLGVNFLQRAGIEAQTLIASEFENFERVTEDTLVIAVSQSGETRDVLDAIEHSKEQGATIASITNVPMSTIERKSKVNLRIQAQQEICVAATKTFANQVELLMELAHQLGDESLDTHALGWTLKKHMGEEKTAAMETAGIINKKLKEQDDDFYIIGSGLTYPLAREISLKMKEISYVHAEGMMAGEFKHGTLALIQEDTPVLALDMGDLDSSISEVESRGAHVIHKEFKDIEENINDWESEALFLMRATVFGFWLTYYLAKYRGLPIDKPRNLAKSVTVK